jgi:hypothetical protein
MEEDGTEEYLNKPQTHLFAKVHPVERKTDRALSESGS